MSKRAEKYAHSTYPPFYEDGMYRRDNTEIIQVAIKAYEQAEKDLALTIEDMERIHTFLYAIKNNKSGAFTFTRLSDEQYEEAIRRYNEWREKK